MRRSSDFRHAVRGGVRSGRATLVVHAAPRDDAGVQVGFVVAKAVGNAVTRNRVRRRLRHLARSHLTRTPAGTALVVRALPAAVGPGADLAADLAAAWARSLSRLDRRGLDQLSSAPS